MSPLTSVEEAAAALAGGGGELRAGGTDVMSRRRTGQAPGPFVDLLDVAPLHGITWQPEGGARVGALTTLAGLAADERIAAGYPALARTVAAIATPQIRAAATVGGNLLQRNRCWYYRNPAFSCHQSGGDGCPARTGAHHYSAVISQGPCIAPHPSSLAPALLAYDATAEVHGRGTLSIADLYGDGSDPSRDHLLAPGEVLTALDLPAPVAGEHAAYHRATSREAGDWPLAEAVARVVRTDGTITTAAVAVGGVARTPLRLDDVAAVLLGTAGTPEDLRAAADLAAERCTPLEQNGYKVELLRATVLEALESLAQ